MTEAGAEAGADAGAEPEAALAAALQRVAVLIGAGLSPRTAWAHVGEASADATVAAVGARVAQGDAVPVALVEVALRVVASRSRRATVAGADGLAAWRSTAAAWRVAETSGAPLAPALRAFAEGLRDREAARRDIRIALAGPRSTASIVLLLPAIALLLALLMGVDLVGALASPLGAAALVAGGALVVVARRWMRRLLRAAEPPAPTTGLALDLLAVAAGGGASPERAVALVAAELRAAHPELAAGGALDPDLAAIADLAAFSRRAGAPLGELARTEAAELRARARALVGETAEALGVRLMLPLGACILPAFLLIGVVPMLIGLLSSTAGAP
ncbi:type II secretion system F family protein [Microcella frigidaquae]|uniref:type II secretion system F family protein n=1 Tax=Microcella frigidaquae TaxID=424758 RepID=UPI0031DF4139